MLILAGPLGYFSWASAGQPSNTLAVYISPHQRELHQKFRDCVQLRYQL